MPAINTNETKYNMDSFGLAFGLSHRQSGYELLGS
jgi:hypothetical protein